MTKEIKKDKEIGVYTVTYYCYNAKCPIRTKKEPWPRSDGIKKWIKKISKKGNMYRKKIWVCEYCGKEMNGTFDANVFA